MEDKNKEIQLTEEQIKKINSLSPNEWQTNEQGVFVEPYGIPVHIKEPVVYMRYDSGGVSGGSCWESSNPRRYTNDDVPKFKVLDLVLQELMPNISYLQFKEIEELIKETSDTDYEYYGNSTDYEIRYIVLSELINKLKSFK